MEIEQHVWGFTSEGEAILLYTMTNAEGAYVKLTNLGAAIVAIGVPDRNGKIEDVALGFNDFHSYFGDSAYLGKTAGRYANRIARGRFTLNGRDYRLAINNAPNHLHGGPKGLSEVLWQSRTEVNRVVFSYVSPDGEEGYPGTVGIEAVYDWNDRCELEITYYAKTDAPTILNLTNHVYFNLRGEGNGDILSHQLQLDASRYLPIDRNIIPTGEPAPVEGTPMDFRTPKTIGRDIEADDPQLGFGNGYDHSWAIDGWEKGKMRRAGMLYDPESGRTVTVETDQPDIHIYTGNYLDGIGINKQGKEHRNREGVAMECQLFPDTPNHPQFPTAVLNPDESYEARTIYRFGTK